MKKSEVNLLKKIFLFLFGLTNIIPSQINLYEYIVDFIEKGLLTTNVFYSAIVFGIWFFRFLIVFGTIYELYNIFKYNHRYKVFGYK
tara:strand:- start:150 stop:410 length:261 start_codon:yes stop_codon:yes gene_type:complete